MREEGRETGEMLKWLVNVYGQEGEGGQGIPDKITEDPLATIRLGKKKKTDQIYSVNRLVFFFVL